MKYSKETGAFYAMDFDYQKLPDDLIDVSQADFERAVDLRGRGGVLDVVNGVLVMIEPAPSPAHDWDAKKQTWMLNKARAAELKEAEKNAQVTAAIEAVRAALKAAINVQFEALNARLGADFKDADAFTVYAGFENAFQREAAAFGAWTALVWKTASEYKAQVMAGKAPMLSPDEAVKMMPEFKVAS